MKIKGVHAPAFGGQDGGRKIHMEREGFTIIKMNGESQKRDAIECPVESIKQMDHPAVYPLKIIRELILLLSPPDGIVLDPYLGSGTTALAAKNSGRRYIGCEISRKYCHLAERRLRENGNGGK